MSCKSIIFESMKRDEFMMFEDDAKLVYNIKESKEVKFEKVLTSY